MTEETFRLINPDGRELELPVHKGTTGPDAVSYTHLTLPTIQL